jgi:hypothetical protein
MPTGQSPQKERLSPVTEYLPLGQQTSVCLNLLPVYDALDGRKTDMTPGLSSKALVATVTALSQLNVTETRFEQEANAEARTVTTVSGTAKVTSPVE